MLDHLPGQTVMEALENREFKNRCSGKAVLQLHGALGISGSQSGVTWNQLSLTCREWKCECRNIISIVLLLYLDE